MSPPTAAYCACRGTAPLRRARSWPLAICPPAHEIQATASMPKMKSAIPIPAKGPCAESDGGDSPGVTATPSPAGASRRPPIQLIVHIDLADVGGIQIVGRIQAEYDQLLAPGEIGPAIEQQLQCVGTVDAVRAVPDQE